MEDNRRIRMQDDPLLDISIALSDAPTCDSEAEIANEIALTVQPKVYCFFCVPVPVLIRVQTFIAGFFLFLGFLFALFSPGWIIFCPQLIWTMANFSPNYWWLKKGDCIKHRREMYWANISWLFLLGVSEGLWIAAMKFVPKDAEDFESYITVSYYISGSLGFIQCYLIYVTRKFKNAWKY